MDNMKELDLNEMEAVSGGKNEGGYSRKPSEKSGCRIYQIKPGETLGKIARANGTTVNKIMAVNPELKSADFIVAHCFIYIPD